MRAYISMRFLIFLLTGTFPLTACAAGPPSTYSAESIEAWVMDEETNQPLEGVNVVAHWALFGGMHTDVVGQLVVLETVTDAQGRFFFPAWGPKKRPQGFLWYADPTLLLFKSGYAFKHISNEVTERPDPSPVRRSEWNRKSIRLKKFSGSLEKYAAHVGSFDRSDLAFAFRFHDCSWKQIPRMLVAMDQENQRFKKQLSRDSGLYPESIENRERDKSDLAECGSIQEFLRSYLP